MRRRKPPRGLSAEDQRLWQAVQATVRPLSGPPVEPPATLATSEDRPRAPNPGIVRQHRAPVLSDLSHRIGAGDPGQVKRVARGRLPIGATLDLHGMTQMQAAARLENFLGYAQDSGTRVVLVITGKGPPDQVLDPYDDAPRGILRRRFLEWVQMKPLSDLVASVHEAHLKHGGRGAFYVFLKKVAR